MTDEDIASIKVGTIIIHRKGLATLVCTGVELSPQSTLYIRFIHLNPQSGGEVTKSYMVLKAFWELL